MDYQNLHVTQKFLNKCYNSNFLLHKTYRLGLMIIHYYQCNLEVHSFNLHLNVVELIGSRALQLYLL